LDATRIVALGTVVDPVDDEHSNDVITRDYRILQRRGGHRYSLDDLAVAWEAVSAKPEAASHLDLGCGIGSVLLMVAWKLERARVFGVEAQAVSADLARRNVAQNGLDGRATIIEGDLREVSRAWPHARCDLITGTPPYFRVGTALASPDPQRAAARLELRGGVEAYLEAAGRVLADGGRVVVCADGRSPDRVLAGAAAADLWPIRRRDVHARAGAEHALFSVWTLGRERGDVDRCALLIRDAEGEQTDDARNLRATFGL
jgi:tRNA1(Val) A37 N6-methylase TrmN6